MAAGGRPAGSNLRSLLREIDRWVCLAGERCCVSRSLRDMDKAKTQIESRSV